MVIWQKLGSSRVTAKVAPMTEQLRQALALIERLPEAAQAEAAARIQTIAEEMAERHRREPAAQERSAIDAAFATMADDADYQAEALDIEAEFARGPV